MTPERWQQVSRIFRSAISLEDEARKVYVAEQCGEDESLRSAVEKLIDSHHRADEENFIGGRAAEDGAVLLIVDDDEQHQPPRLTKGQQFGSYVILDGLGAGGMGEVYLARDSRLDRTVALKVLTHEIAADKRRMQRFRQEAKVASSLNHPNILTIYDFGDIDGLTFLATEYIDGETLRDHLRATRPRLPEVLDILIQVLAALDAAHEARIVHRDIKPENVMIRRRDRVVKVLDFGLAKVAEKRSRALTDQASDLEAATAFKTAPGMLMGTINYMSPEQARAQSVDERTDIWSTGVMLYEMLTGVPPFGGPTTSHTLVQIIEKEPPPLTKTMDTPPELQRIVGKAMAKSLDERYQTAKDMLIDLRNLRRQLEGGIETPSQVHPGPDKKRVLLIALIAMAVVTAAIFGVNLWRASRRSSVVAVPSPSPPSAVPERVLYYSITVQKFRNRRPYEKPFTMAGEINFERDYRVRLNVRSPQTGHLYVLNEGPRERTAPAEFVSLFPSPTANNGSSFLLADQQVQIPESTWLRFDEDEGVEKLWLIFSEDALPELEALRSLVNPLQQGLIGDAARNKSIENFLSAQSTSKPEAEKGSNETAVKAPGKMLVYAINLEHH